MSKANVNVTVRSDALNNIVKKLNSTDSQNKVGDLVVDEMKKSLGAGIPPIRGSRRFDVYSESYSKQIKRGHPENPSKKIRPVNLFLSGKMLSFLKHRINGGKLEIGIINADQETQKIAIAHQTGTKNMPKRRFIPSRKGEKLTVTIDRAIKNLYVEIINRLIK